ncbi:SRPBCC family protein [Paenibacillus sp. HJGM_3]|uniref:SRPBCC family protein n=1 Tax=Paenibacillus sp. HJGM_3 TaxID=3379816 RepID=UPI00385EE499
MNETMVKDNQILTTRVFKAPRELVYEVWTKPEHLDKWWGPNGFKNTFQEFDFRPGGHWRFIMHGPDGTDYQNHNVFKDIVKPERIVFEHTASPHFVTTVLFEDLGKETKIHFRMEFDSAEECKEISKYAVEGNKETLDRLEALLDQLVG